jgi:hypothetical protein
MEIVRKEAVPRKIIGLTKDPCKETGPNKVTDQILRKDQIWVKDQQETGRKETDLLKVSVHKGIVLHFARVVVPGRKINQMKIRERTITQKVKLSFFKAKYNVSGNKYLADIVVCSSKSYGSFVNS